MEEALRTERCALWLSVELKTSHLSCPASLGSSKKLLSEEVLSVHLDALL